MLSFVVNGRVLYDDVFCNGFRAGVSIIMIITVNNEIMLRIYVTIKGLRKCNLQRE